MWARLRMTHMVLTDSVIWHKLNAGSVKPYQHAGTFTPLTTDSATDTVLTNSVVRLG